MHTASEPGFPPDRILLLASGIVQHIGIGSAWPVREYLPGAGATPANGSQPYSAGKADLRGSFLPGTQLLNPHWLRRSVAHPPSYSETSQRAPSRRTRRLATASPAGA